MASSSSFSLGGQSPTFLISNIGSLISIKLGNHNYLLWKSQFLPVLRANGLIGFIDGSSVCPSEYVLDLEGNPTKEPNPKYYEWIQQDQNVLCWINATLSESVLAYVVGLSSARAVWVALEKRFASLSRSHIIQLKTQLQSVKKGNQSIAEYVQKVKHLADSLASASCPVDDDDLIIYTLNGLPPEYGPFKTSIRTHSDTICLEELNVLLSCEELNIEPISQSVVDFSSTALLATNDDSSRSANFNNNKGRSGYRGKGRGRYNNNKGKGSGQNFSTPNFQPRQNSSNSAQGRPCCQICNRTGHTALDCYHRMDFSYQGRNPPSQLAAMAASYNTGPDQTWFADSGATNHITNDMKNLSLQTDYQGTDKVSIGNGQG